MKRLYIFLLLVLIPTILLAQYKYDGRRIWPSTIDSTKFTQDRSAAIGPAVIGGVQMVDATFGEMWIPVDWDSIASGGTTVNAVRGSNPWGLTITQKPDCNYQPASGKFQFKVMGFDADAGSTGDDSVYCVFPCPANYKDDTMELYLYWFHLDDNGAHTDIVTWDGTLQVSGATDSTVSFLSTAGTGLTAVAHTCTYTGPGGNASADSILFITNLDPEVVDIDAGDLIRLLLWVDESASSLDSGEKAYLLGILVRWDILDTP